MSVSVCAFNSNLLDLSKHSHNLGKAVVQFLVSDAFRAFNSRNSHIADFFSLLRRFDSFFILADYLVDCLAESVQFVLKTIEIYNSWLRFLFFW